MKKIIDTFLKAWAAFFIIRILYALVYKKPLSFKKDAEGK